MFAHFVCALLLFHARDFPAKSSKKPGHLLSTEGRMSPPIILLFSDRGFKYIIEVPREPPPTSTVFGVDNQSPHL